jgi:predicted transcriptional regulator
MENPNFGALELAVLKFLWRSGAAPAKDVHRELGSRRRISLNTIQSTLERLHRKGMLDRHKVSHAYHYEPSMTRGELLAKLVDDMLGLLSGDRRDLLAAFVDLVDRTDSATLEQLERMLADRRRAD